MPDLPSLSLGASLAAFAAAGVVVLVCGIRLTRLADRFADLSGMGEAVTGALFLGALTSLAGSVTSVTAAAGGATALALSNAFGGIAAQTVFLVAADVVHRRANLEHAAASLPNMISGTVLVVLLSLVLVPRLLPEVAVLGVHPMTPVLVAVYLGGVGLASRTRRTQAWRPAPTDATEQDVPDEAAARRGPLLATLASILGLGAAVAASGWVIATTGLAIAARTGIAEGVVGAVMTAIVTSTPELVTTVAAVRRGALTLAVGGILGGNAFDVLFVAFADVAYREGSIYHAIAPGEVFLVHLAIVMTAVLLLGLLSREKRGPANIGVESLALLGLYAAGVATLTLAF